MAKAKESRWTLASLRENGFVQRLRETAGRDGTLEVVDGGLLIRDHDGTVLGGPYGGAGSATEPAEPEPEAAD